MEYSDPTDKLFSPLSVSFAKITVTYMTPSPIIKLWLIIDGENMVSIS